MRQKIILFIVLIFIALLIGLFAGWEYASAGGGILGVLGAIFAGRSIRDDGRGNNRGIDGQLEKEGDLNNREGELNRGERVSIDRERKRLSDEREELGRKKQSLDDEKRNTRRDRKLLEELQKRHPKG